MRACVSIPGRNPQPPLPSLPSPVLNASTTTWIWRQDRLLTATAAATEALTMLDYEAAVVSLDAEGTLAHLNQLNASAVRVQGLGFSVQSFGFRGHAGAPEPAQPGGE